MNLSIKIIDYKKKYNDALERARDLMSNQNCSTPDKHLIETIFPELKDDEEDENTHIKKVLIDYFQKYKEQEDCGIKTFYGIPTDNILAWLEKQNATKDIDMSDLKPDTWIVHNTLGTCKIVKENVYAPGYDVISYNDEKLHFIGFDFVGFDKENKFYLLNDCHLWTIYDANDGDVLVNGSNIFIFHFINNRRLMGYCHVNMDDGNFYNDIGKNECFCTIDAPVTPATKEQRDALMKAMNDAGYKWNPETKTLKKLIETKFKVGDKFDPKTLQPFDKVLVRDDRNEKW